MFQSKLTAYNPVTTGENALHGATLFKYNDFVKARRLRLHVVSVALPATLWEVLAVGALINIALTWLLPVQGLKGHLLLSGAFAAVVGLLLFAAAAMDNPFRGELSVSPHAYQVIADNIMGIQVGHH